MKFVRAVLLAATLALSASSADFTGTWKATFLGDPGTWPKMVSKMTFELRADGNQVTGMAHMSHWPGDAPLSDGKIEGDRISFVVVGKSPWKSAGPRGEASGFPRLTFTGTINGKDMELHLVWDSVVIYGDVSGSGRELEMAGKKVSD